MRSYCSKVNKMSGKLKENSYLIVCILFFAFSLIQSMCLIFRGDDFLWSMKSDFYNSIFGSYCENGRYFSNIITYFATKNSTLRVFCYTLFFYLLFLTVSRIADIEKSKNPLHCLTVSMLIMSTPLKISSDAVMWFAGFTNYIISAVFSLIYIYLCIPLLKGEKCGYSAVKCVFISVTGFVGALCIENITLYNIFLGIFMLVLSCKINKKLLLGNRPYLVSTVAGCIIMFTNKNYSDIMNGADRIQSRKINFEMSDVFQKIYSTILLYYSQPFFAVHAIIALSAVLMYAKKYKNSGNKPKYAVISIAVTIAYAVFSICSQTGLSVISLTVAMRTNALEFAFTFIYIVSLIYLAWVFLEKSAIIRTVLYICSTIAVNAPFAVTEPTTPRCFFAGYIFWILTALEFFSGMIKNSDFSLKYALKTILTVATPLLMFIISYSNIENKYVDNLRINHIRSQIEGNKKAIELIALPYPLQTTDCIEGVKPDGDRQFGEGYFEMVCRYYKFDRELMKDKEFIVITMLDYTIDK